MKVIWKRRERIEKERMGKGIKKVIFGIVTLGLVIFIL
jgi:hypothetical protein